MEEMSLTMYHPVGTCRMGAVGDPMGVTDSHLRVKGIKGLRWFFLTCVNIITQLPAVCSSSVEKPSAFLHAIFSVVDECKCLNYDI